MNTWVNFDMTMVRFYIDGWSKKYGKPEKWVFATNEEMFELQPQRTVKQIIGADNNTLLTAEISASNQQELNEFLKNLQPCGKIPK